MSLTNLEGIDDTQLLSYGVVGVIKQAIGAMPIVGGIVLGMLDEVEKLRAQQMMDELSEEIQILGRDKINLSFIESEEFLDLFCRVLRARTRHRSKVKAKLFIKLLSESMQNKRDARFGVEIKETFVSLIDQMSDDEIFFLSDFAKGIYDGKTKDSVYQLGDKSKSIALDALLGKRILSNDESWDQDIRASMLGKELIAYIQILAHEL